MGMKDLPVCFQNNLPEGTRYTCPWCQKTIIADDSKLTMFHEMPVCARFTAEAKSHGGPATKLVIVRS